MVTVKCQTVVSGQTVQCYCGALSVRPQRSSPALRLQQGRPLSRTKHAAAGRSCPLRASKDGKQSNKKQNPVPQVRTTAQDRLAVKRTILQATDCQVYIWNAATRGRHRLHPYR